MAVNVFFLRLRTPMVLFFFCQVQVLPLTTDTTEETDTNVRAVYFSLPSNDRVVLKAGPAMFGVDLVGKTPTEAKLAMVEPPKGCEDITNGQNIRGRIALVYRGDCMFIEKAGNIQKTGAVAAIVIDNDPGITAERSSVFIMHHGFEDVDVTIPMVFLYAVEAAVLLDAYRQQPELVVGVADVAPSAVTETEETTVIESNTAGVTETEETAVTESNTAGVTETEETAVTESNTAGGDKENEIIGLVGNEAELPCDVNVESCGYVYFITWTKNVSNEWKRLYLYSDTIAKPLQELANPTRAVFTHGASSGSLKIFNLRLEDDGIYKCDVTYDRGKCPSLSYATLFIHAEPSAPVIEKDGKVSPNGTVVGPYIEGETLSLECETEGGKPTPEVTWYKDNEELDSESHVTVYKNGSSTVTSSVRVTLERDDRGKKIECHVDNEAIDRPLVTWVEINLYDKPECDIDEDTDNDGNAILVCTAKGNPALINFTWFKDNETLDDEYDMEFENTRSTLVLPKPPESYGMYKCMAVNNIGVSEPCHMRLEAPSGQRSRESEQRSDETTGAGNRLSSGYIDFIVISVLFIIALTISEVSCY